MKLKISLFALASMVFCIFSGGVISTVYGLPPLPVTGVLIAASCIPQGQWSSTLQVGLYREVWTKDVIRLIDEGLKETFLDGIMDLSRYVTGDEEHQTIHSTFFNVYPDVLINNSTYPINIQALDGVDKTIELDKYQTLVTPITDDELPALAFDKTAEVKKSHAMAILRQRLLRSVYNLSPSFNSQKTPIIKTTGAKTADRVRLRWEDIVNLREKLQSEGISIEDMRLVLCGDHVNDLLLEDKDLFNVLTNFKSGIVLPQLGFDIRSYSACPYYKVSDLTKLSFGGTVTSEHRMASFIFAPSLARKARGKTIAYLSQSNTDPLYQRNLLSFRDYFIAQPILSDTHLAAIVSDIPTA